GAGADQARAAAADRQAGGARRRAAAACLRRGVVHDGHDPRRRRRLPGEHAMISGNGSARSVYDYWLGMLPQFFAQIGAAGPPSPKPDASTASLPFPADQVAKAAAMTSDALQRLAQSYAPILQSAGAPGLLAQWAAAALPMM